MDMKISDAIKYIGVNDHQVDLFEGQFEVPMGMAYNSYVILDEKIAVMDSVDQNFGDEWISNLKKVLAENGNRTPDYLVVHHMEMDHSANVKRFIEEFPNTKIVASKMAFVMMKNLFGSDFQERQIVAGEGFELELGSHVLRFVAAPNVHWPEVLMSYEKSEGVLFSADGFGKFGANDVDDPEGWACEARRYYFGIVGKFGNAVQTVLKKAASLKINIICPLHGPVLNENLDYYLNTYNTWSSYGVETEGIAIFYTSVYGNTKKAAEIMAESLINKGAPKVVLNDLAREDMYECVEDAFRYGKIVLATTTYNGSVFPKMKEFLEHLKDRDYQKRKIGIIENGTWVPCAAKGIKSILESFKEISFYENIVTIKTSVTAETEKQIQALADEILR